jgi:hypothetical protein
MFIASAAVDVVRSKREKAGYNQTNHQQSE